MLKKVPFARNVSIFRVMAKKRFIHIISQENVLLSVMLIIFELWPKNDFLHNYQKIDLFARNIDSFRDMANIQFFTEFSKK